jgi:xylulose-5-phosphate/fructose-6-phosphate phosphoketolase
VNVIVAGKQPCFDWLDLEQARAHCARGVGVWEWAGTEQGDTGPDVVLACAGDVPTHETLAAASLLREWLPQLAVRVVNVVDMARLMSSTEHPHGLSDAEFDTVFTRNRPVIFAYHGYPWLVHRLTYSRAVHDRLAVRGYRESGSTTPPFDMVVRNGMDRYHLVMDVIDRTEGLGSRAAGIRQRAADMRERHHRHVVEHGTDMPEVTGWRWTGR